MRFGSILLVSLAFGVASGLGGAAPTVTAQTSIGFRDPGNMEALLSYRLPDWGYRTIAFQLGLMGNGEKLAPCYFCRETTSAAASEALGLDWYHESEERVWSLFTGQRGTWNWNQASQEPEDTIASDLEGLIFVGALNRNYAVGNLFIFENVSMDASYREGRTHEGSNREVIVGRSFNGNIGLGAGLGRVRDVTPVLQAQRLSERLQALGREPLPVEDVLRLASVLAQNGGYQRVFDRPDRQLWRDVLEPLVGRGETLTPFEVFYLSDVFYEALGSRREGFLVQLGGQVQRSSQEYGSFVGATYWAPNLQLEWSHNFNLDHQLSAFASGFYSWSDYDIDDQDAERELGEGFVTLQYLWVVADRFLWRNELRDSFVYRETIHPVNEPLIARQQYAQLISSFSFHVEDRVRMGPVAGVNWRWYESEGDWFEQLNWTLQFNVTYELDNTLF